MSTALYSLTFDGFDLIVFPLLRCVIILLFTWVIIKFLPTALKKVGLQAATNDTTLRWLNAALIGFVLAFAIIQPFVAFVDRLPL